MAGFIQQNWVGIILVAAMLAMHLGGHRHGGHGGPGLGGGCGAGHPRQGTRVGDDQTQPDALQRPRSGKAAEAPAEPAPDAVRPDPTRDVLRPDPTRDAVNPDDGERVSTDRSQRFLRPPDRQLR
jgi:hypothetical protein